MHLGRASALAVVSSLVLTACEVPSEGPILEQLWEVPVEETRVGVDELLPSGVSVDGETFAVAVNALATGRSLGSLCSQCGLVQGLTAPVPAFSGTFTTSSALPARVLSATLASGSVQLQIRNDFGFDPLSGGGTITVALTDGPGGRSLGLLTLDGARGDALAPGSTVTRTIPLAAGAVGATLSALTTVQVPGGALAQVDTAQQVRVTATPSAIRVSSARVTVAGEAVDFDDIVLDVEDVDFDDHIEGGAVLLDVANPFGVGFVGQLRVNYPGGTISKPVTIGAGATSRVEIPFSADELRAFLGTSPVTFTASGSVPSTAGSVSVTPRQALEVDARIQLTLTIGG